MSLLANRAELLKFVPTDRAGVLIVVKQFAHFLSLFDETRVQSIEIPLLCVVGEMAGVVLQELGKLGYGD